MISVQNRLPLSSGNRWLLFSFIALIAAACSPKLQPIAVQPEKKEVPKPVVKIPEPVKPASDKVSTISLLLPFGLDHLKGKPYTPVSLKEADLALDYYRGFKLALDSLAGQGYNYKLQVYDTRADKAQAHSLALNPAVKKSDFIVGPVFPDDIKSFISTFKGTVPILSPLSPAAPSTFKNAGLITAVPPLEYHAWAAAKYITGKLKIKKVFILRSGFSEENDYLVPFKKAMDSLGKTKIKVIQLTVVHGQLNNLIPEMNKGGQNVFIVPSTNQHFLTVTLHTLDSLSNVYPVTLFGHPNWVNYAFLRTDLLQKLNTYVTASDRVDYKDPTTLIFMREYRDIYLTEATEYAIKGFDEGMYFGEMLGNGNLKDFGDGNFEGLHNDFQFQKKNGLGWINTHVNLFKYSNFELKKVE